MKNSNETSAIMHINDKFKASLYLLVSIAAVFIAIIPARICMGIFSGDKTIFLIALVGNIGIFEVGVWICLSGPLEIYQSFKGGKKQAEFSPAPVQECLSEPAELPEPIVQSEAEPLLTDDAQAIELDSTPRTDLSVIYDKGYDDYHNNQSAKGKEILAKIEAYILYILAPFMGKEDLYALCGEFMAFAIAPLYKPKPWNGLKGTLSSFDVRHLTWNIAVRLGLGKGKPYSTELCIDFIRTLFPDICEGLDPSTLKNLRTTSPSEKIHIDAPGQDGISFHIPEAA